MKYHYESPQIVIPVYGERITLDHPVFQSGTLYLEHEKGILVVQQHFDEEEKVCWWGYLDSALSNDIYLTPKFKEFFIEHATEKDYPIYQVRKLMWALRMKPLRRGPWEDVF